jgi:tRNA(Ile)-lysidine synthase
MSFSPASLRAVLEAHTPPAATGLVVALSGGMDSACLATALALLPKSAVRQWPVRAVHVDHGLQAAAAAFRRACAALCERLDLPLTVIEVSVDSSAGVSLEAAARDARYLGLSRELEVGECLLTAHHAQDQAETLLLQLLRGAGLKGMSGMPMCRALGAGWHLRPLLDVAKRDLLRFGEAAGVSATTDPMNQDQRFDRVYLRSQIWPLLEQRWPGAPAALSRAARHMADAQALLDQAAAAAVQRLRDGNALSMTGLRVLTAAQQLNALRFWIGCQGVPVPPTARLVEALRQFSDARDDHLPAIAWGAHALRRYRQRLFLTEAQPPRMGEPVPWLPSPESRLPLGDALGRLSWCSQRGGLDPSRLPGTLTVRRRVGGETLRPHPHAKTHSVQHLCQALGVLPWMRDALPLVYAGESLVAVADLWQDARWCVGAEVPGLGVVWQDAPIVA